MKNIKVLTRSFIVLFLVSFLNLNSQSKFTVLATYQIPGKASGLAFDGSSLYCGIYGVGGDKVYQIDTSDGSSVFLCTGPMDDAYGLCYDGQYFWTTFHNAGSQPAWAIRFDASGTQLDTFELMTTYMSGIEYDNGYFWVAAYYGPDGEIYKTDTGGNIHKQFPSPFAQPWDLCLQDEYLWIADYYNNTIDKVDTSGNLIDSQPSLGDRPAGITFDGKYLWYVAGPLNDSSTLYKVEIDITQEPKIMIPVADHDFGDVLVGGSGVWNAKVRNIGNADLQIDSIIFNATASPFSSATILPVIIPAGDSADIEFMFKPLTSGVQYDTAVVYSNSAISAPDLKFRGNGTTVGFEDKKEDAEFSVYPNPFSEIVAIHFAIDKPQNVSLRIFNVIGDIVMEWSNQNLPEGEYRTLWNGTDSYGNKLPKGTYYCVIRFKDDVFTRKLILLEN